DVDRADRLREAQDLDAKVGEQLSGHAACGDSGGGLASRRPLEHVAYVVVAVFERAGEVRMARPEPRHGLGRKPLPGSRHLRGPISVILVFQDERDGAPDGETSPNAADDPRMIRLDLLPPAAAVPPLAP